jgi:hypothetical protein
MLQQWGKALISKRYLTRQASALIKFAKSTNNPELAAVLVERAADLKAQVDEKMPPPYDRSPGLQFLQERWQLYKRHRPVMPRFSRERLDTRRSL